MGGNDSGEIGSFQAMPIEPDEGGTDEEQLQRALDMSMMDDDNDEIGPF